VLPNTLGAARKALLNFAGKVLDVPLASGMGCSVMFVPRLNTRLTRRSRRRGRQLSGAGKAFGKRPPAKKFEPSTFSEKRRKPFGESGRLS
jgi:hypothetical protein